MKIEVERLTVTTDCAYDVPSHTAYWDIGIDSVMYEVCTEHLGQMIENLYADIEAALSNRYD